VRYDGTDIKCPCALLERWSSEGRAIPFCPELAAGLSVPRPAAEIVGGDGHGVLDGRASVVDEFGRDVTGAFLAGARQALEAARTAGVRLAILKDRSPSCGSLRMHDGTFTGRLVPGVGVTAALLRRTGIRVFSESEVELAGDFVRSLETTAS
jgi:uncharacterized protein YbbK (DUF523 family)